MRFWKKFTARRLDPNDIRLVGEMPLEYDARDELLPFVPASLDAAQDNFGQGDGQIRIEDTLWGVYEVGSSYEMHLRFEEGSLSPERFQAHLEGIRQAAEQYFGFPVRIEIVGLYAAHLEPTAA
ncbi:MAG: hypothetical protein QNK04_09255 [Myxococcota bacterium]|nr:hypothetical protein [Myxococcota bacterium]